jgi:hypothetical protein
MSLRANRSPSRMINPRGRGDGGSSQRPLFRETSSECGGGGHQLPRNTVPTALEGDHRWTFSGKGTLRAVLAGVIDAAEFLERWRPQRDSGRYRIPFSRMFRAA